DDESGGPSGGATRGASDPRRRRDPAPRGGAPREGASALVLPLRPREGLRARRRAPPMGRAAPRHERPTGRSVLPWSATLLVWHDVAGDAGGPRGARALGFVNRSAPLSRTAGAGEAHTGGAPDARELPAIATAVAAAT